MATVLEIKKYLENMKNDEKLYIMYSDDNELNCEIYTEENIIDKANNEAGSEDFDEEERITDIDSALQYLSEMRDDEHYMELDL